MRRLFQELDSSAPETGNIAANPLNGSPSDSAVPPRVLLPNSVLLLDLMASSG
jgi:hypothetical protein